MPNKYDCVDCGEFTDPYMINNKLWDLLILNTRECLCLKCLELRLGRDLVLSDFPKLKINRPIFLGAVMARKEEAEKNANISH